MGHQIHERDLTAIPFRELHVGGQIFRDRIRECDFTLLDHVGKQKCGEYFADRANLKDGVAIERAWVSLVAMTVGDDPAALGSDHADDDADAILLRSEGVDTIREDLSNIGIRWEFEWV